jgi:dnd system-associated protein 4
MRDIRRPDNLEPIVERLTSGDFTETGIPVFPTIMDLLIFAAGVGFNHNRRVPVPSTGRAIPIRIFENNQKDGYLHLVALAKKEDPTVLTTDFDDETVKMFEEFAAGGLEIISDWFSNSPSDSSGVETLLAEMQRLMPQVPQSNENPSPL